MRPTFGFVLAALTCLAIGGPVTGAPSAPPSTTDAALADSLYRNADWPAAARAYAAITRRDATNGRAWYRLGGSYYGLKRYRDAIAAWSRSEAIGHNPNVMYNLGVGYALVHDRDHAFEWLEKAVTAGFGQEAQLAGDADLADLRGDPRWATLAAHLHAVTAPCESDPRWHQFDFWIGEWDVKNPQGQPVGRSSIQQILNQCVIFENWSGLGGGSGKSFNTFNTATGHWQQLWVDDRGTTTEFTDGAFADGWMRFLTHSRDAQGGEILGRLSFTALAEDRVRQWKERSTDRGATWTTDYDFIYERRP